MRRTLIEKVPFIFMVFIFIALPAKGFASQNGDYDASIESLRKGEIIVMAKRGAQVSVEQVSHEFWFGSAIANSIFNGSASEYDRAQYKQKFLENFNSAVTENAVKWADMERRLISDCCLNRVCRLPVSGCRGIFMLKLSSVPS